MIANTIRVHSYESMGIFDGPGLRLVVFLQGCNFKCLYCANPDTIPIGKSGKIVDIEEVLRRAVSEKVFFGKKGGVTFSGGEPTVQAKELIPLLNLLRKENIHICIDTNGSIWNSYVKEVFSLVDLVLLDVKEFNPLRHQKLTNHTNRQTIKTAEYLNSIGKPMRIRYVLVPGYTDFEEDIVALAEEFQHLEMIDRVEVLPYHTFGVHKYESLNMDYFLRDIEENTEENINRCVALFKKYFKNVWTQ